MEVTEEAAAGRWCPLRRSFEELNGGPVTITAVRPEVRDSCIGAECMAWRWLDPDWKEGRRGYCGFAGHPAPLIVAGVVQ